MVDEPYPVPTVTYGWAAGDAAYAIGSFDLVDDEALVIEGRSPECAFWHLCSRNPSLHTYEYERVTIDGGQLRYEPDGWWTIVVAGRDPGHPNRVSTAGRWRGRIWLRWFHPSSTPERPVTRVQKLPEPTRSLPPRRAGPAPALGGAPPPSRGPPGVAAPRRSPPRPGPAVDALEAEHAVTDRWL